MPMQAQEIEDLIRATFPDAQAIYLFGSHATGQVHATSDVDIAVLLPPRQAAPLGSHRLFEVAARVGVQLPCDVVNLRCVSTVLQAEIVTTAERLYCADALAADDFEMQAITRFQHFSRERRTIVEAGLEDGFYRTDRS